MVITLMILIPIMSFGTSYLVIKAYSKGLQHNFEIKSNIMPKEDKNPIAKVLEGIKDTKREKEQVNIIDEWINGKQ